MANTSKGIHYPDKYSVIADVPEDMKEMAESINDLFEENDIKTTEQDETIQNNTESISELQKENAELKAENALLKSQFPSGKESGEYITLNDSSNLTCKIGIQGNTKQETRSGKNKFNNTYNNLAMWSTGVGQTTTFAEDTSYLGAYCKVEEGKTYSISKAKTTSRFVVAFCNEVPTANSTALVQYRNDSALKIENIKVPEGYSYLVLYLSNSSETFEGLNLQIEEGTVATDYELYGAMPSPEFPSEIQNVNGNIDITVCNENLLYNDWAEDFVNRINDESKAKIEEINGKRYLSYLASAGYVAGQDYKDSKAYFIKGIFKEKTQYIFSCKLMLNTERREVNIIVRYTDGTNGFLYLSQNAKSMEEVDYYVTTDKFKTVYSIGVHYQTGKTYIDLSTVTLKEGNNSNYIEPQSQKITFPLSEGQRLYEGSYLADDGIHHKRGQTVLNGTENIVLYDNNNHLFSMAINNIKKSLCVCSHFKGVSSGFATTDYSCLANDYGIYINDKDITGIDNFKSYLANQYNNGTPVTVEYELAEEVIEPYTEEQQVVYNEIQKATSYKNVTHIFSTNKTSAVFDVTYKRDLETLFNNINSALVEGGM